MDAEPWTPDVRATFAATGASLVPGPRRERHLAALSYLVMWITGLLVLATARPTQRYARWHAIQAIGFGIVATVLAVTLNLLSFVLLQVAGPVFPVQETPWYAMGSLIGLMALGFIVVFALESSKGRTVRIPFVSALADRYA